MSNVSVVVGNPKPRSRTYQAAILVAEKLAGRPPDQVVDVVDLAASLLDGPTRTWPLQLPACSPVHSLSWPAPHTRRPIPGC